MANLRTEIEVYNVLKTRLAEAYSLEDDDAALLDTLEGASPIQDIIIKMCRDAKLAEAYAEAMKAIIADNAARKKRHETRAEKLRELAVWAMQEISLKKIEEADLTISQRTGEKKLIVTTDADISSPERFTRMKEVYSWDREALRVAVESGDQQAMAIAYLDNAFPILTIRTK